ncbi:MAG: hypothetical protein AAB316_04195, partial [Bacteroidota bacterium]
MNNFHQPPQQEDGAMPSLVVSFAQHAPLALFCACCASFVILLILQGNHDIEVWSLRMPNLGLLVGAAGALFVQVVRACGLLASTYNFSKGRSGIFAGILSITLSLVVSLYEHNHALDLANFYLAKNDWLNRDYLIGFVQILVWIGLGLEILIIASIYGTKKRGFQPQPKRQP